VSELVDDIEKKKKKKNLAKLNNTAKGKQKHKNKYSGKLKGKELLHLKFSDEE
jgi:hypothetical protein